MKNKDLITNIKNIASLISSSGIIIGLIVGVYTYFNDYKTSQEEILKKIETSQQMSLKSVIWNDHIPLTEQISACDVYLSMGYNSYTKKHCEILLKGVDE